MAEVRPYGAWASPITAASLAEGAIGLADLRVADGKLYWLETRPAEGAPRKEGPKPAAVPAPEAKADGPKAKRSRKRPPLAAVPDREGTRVGKPGKVAGGKPVPQPRPFVAPAPASRPAGAARKRREIPPYLRVVK